MQPDSVTQSPSVSARVASSNEETKISDRLKRSKLEDSLEWHKSPEDSIEFMSEAYPILKKRPAPTQQEAPVTAPLPPLEEHSAHTMPSLKKAIKVAAYKAGLKVAFSPVLLNMETMEQILEFNIRPVTWKGISRRCATVKIFFRAVSVV